MIYELKRALIKEMEKAVEKLNNGYYIDLSSIVDDIFYINTLVSCNVYVAMPGDEDGDCSPLCGPGCDPNIHITTNSPSCTYAGGTALYLELSCYSSGGSAIMLTNPNYTTTTTTLAPTTTLPPTTTTQAPTTTTTTENLNCYYGGGNSAVYVP